MNPKRNDVVLLINLLAKDDEFKVTHSDYLLFTYLATNVRTGSKAVQWYTVHHRTTCHTAFTNNDSISAEHICRKAEHYNT